MLIAESLSRHTIWTTKVAPVGHRKTQIAELSSYSVGDILLRHDLCSHLMSQRLADGVRRLSELISALVSVCLPSSRPQVEDGWASERVEGHAGHYAKSS